MVTVSARATWAGRVIVALLVSGSLAVGDHFLFPPAVGGPLGLTQSIAVPWSGQSNETGSGSASSLSTTQPFDNRLYNGSDTVALIESGAVERPRSGAANQLSFREGASRLSVAFSWGIGATAYSGLEQGTSAYTNAQTDVAEMFADAPSDRSSYTLCAGPLAWVHGETDNGNGLSAAAYESDMVDLAGDWSASDVSAGRTRCRTDPDLLLSQMAQYNDDGAGFRWRADGPTLGQFDAWLHNSAAIWLAGPTYNFPWNADGLHRTNTGHRREGEMFGKALYAYTQGTTWTPLYMSNVSCTANVCTVTFAGGGQTPPVLAVDTTSVALKPFYGFEYRETSPQADLPTVVTVSCSNASCTVTLDRNAEADGLIGLGTRAIPSTVGGSTTKNGSPGSNIRNTQVLRAQAEAINLWDWAAIQLRPIDSCTSCTASSVWSFANTDSFLSDNSPSVGLSAGHITELDSAANWSICDWRRGGGTGNGGSHWAMHAASHRKIDSRGTGTNQEIVFVSSSLSSTSETWTSVVSALAGCVSAWCMICSTYDGSQADGGDAGSDPDDERFNFYVCAAGVCAEISTAGTFAGTFPAALTNDTNGADFAIGSASDGPANQTLEHTMSHVSVWTVTLSSGDVDTLYGAGTPVDPRTVGSGPVHYWPLQNNGADVGSATGGQPAYCYGASAQTGGACWSTLNP